MFDLSENLFLGARMQIPATAKIVFVADLFVEDYVGGAELTTEALISSSPLEVFKLRSKEVTMQLLEQGHDKHWIFGNFTELKPELIPSIVANMKYSIIEYDYKYCRARSPEKHLELLKVPCDCHNRENGKLISVLFFGASHLWWMSEKQKERYNTMFPFLAEKSNTVLSSVFSNETLSLIKILQSQQPPETRKGWIVLGSKSWIKGAEDAEQWCVDNNKGYQVLWNVPYNDLLKELSKAEGFVYLPRGGDTCPRMVIEAKLLGCKLQLNDFVQHKDEEWFATDDLGEIEDYLATATKTFWNTTKAIMDYVPTISGYVTTYNCVRQQYPFKQCIKSMLEFCDEVCIVDGGSNDGTLSEIVTEFMSKNSAGLPCDIEHTITQLYEGTPLCCYNPEGKMLFVKVVHRDWQSKRHPVFDGMQKAEARAMCTKEFCWQMDSDEIVHEDDANKIKDMCRMIPAGADVLSLPVIEYWGGPDKVRMDITPWKWRLSRNKKNITHGIPLELRKLDEDGNLCASPGTDGCDMIDAQSFERLPHASFYTPDIDNVRRVGMLGNEDARKKYEVWFNAVVTSLPSVFHYSWFDIVRKMKLYRDYWTAHWELLMGNDYKDEASSNMFFDIPWSNVTEEMIEARAKELEQIGGWIWHRKWNGEKTPWISCVRPQPKLMMKEAT